VPTPEVSVSVSVSKAVDPSLNPNPNVVVVGYANSVLDEIKENGVIADGGVHLARKESGDQEVRAV